MSKVLASGGFLNVNNSARHILRPIDFHEIARYFRHDGLNAETAC